VAVEVRRHVHQNNAIRLAGGGERRVQEGEVSLARSVGPGRDLDSPDDSGRRAESDETGVAVREREVHRAVNTFEGVPAIRVVEVVVADDADVRDGERLDETEIVLVASTVPGPAKSPRLAKKTGAGSRCATWSTRCA
jgi:hypothetical protein